MVGQSVLEIRVGLRVDKTNGTIVDKSYPILFIIFLRQQQESDRSRRQDENLRVGIPSGVFLVIDDLKRTHA